MAAATNNTLLLRLKALKAGIQNITKFLNVKAGKRNQKLLPQKNPVANKLAQLLKLYNDRFYTFLGFFFYRCTSHTGELYKFKELWGAEPYISSLYISEFFVRGTVGSHL